MTLTLPGAPAQQAVRSVRAAGARAVPGTWPALVGVVALLAGVVSAGPVLVLVGLLASTAALLRRRWPADVAVPLAAAVLLVAAAGTAVTAAVVHLDLLARPWLLATGYVLYAAAVLVRVLTRVRPAVARPDDTPGPRWWAYAPTGVALATGLLQSVSVPVARSWAFYGTDLVHHMTNVATIQRAGHLDYGASSYPQGWHAMAALASVPRAPLDVPLELLDYDLRLVAGLTWACVALMTLTAAVVTVRLGRALGLPGGVADVAAVVLGAGVLLTNTFVNGFVFLGAGPSLLAMAVLWLVPLVAATRRSSPRLLLLVAALAVAGLGHLWQALVLGPVVPLAFLALRAPRASLRALRAGGLLGSVAALVGPGLLLAFGAVPVLAVQRAHGVSGAAGTPGSFPGEPWHVLLPALACLVVVLVVLERVARDRDWSTGLLGGAVALLLAWLVLLRGAGGDLHAWYPVKAAWFLAVFLAPVLALGATTATWWVGRRAGDLLGRAARLGFVLRAACAAVVVAVAFAMWLPYLLGQRSLTLMAWQAAPSAAADRTAGRIPDWSAEHYDLVQRYQREAGRTVLVPYYVGFSAVSDGKGTELVSGLLTFVTGQVQLPGDAHDVCEAIGTVAGQRPATVLTKLPAGLVRADLAAHGCAGRAAVLHVPGGIRDVGVLRSLRRAVAAGAATRDA